MTSQTLQTPTFTVLSPIQNELREATTKFVRVISHNKKVHQQRYLDIVNELLLNKQDRSNERTPASPCEKVESEDPKQLVSPTVTHQEKE